MECRKQRESKPAFSNQSGLPFIADAKDMLLRAGLSENLALF
jgi:hypothetical protein